MKISTPGGRIVSTAFFNIKERSITIIKVYVILCGPYNMGHILWKNGHVTASRDFIIVSCYRYIFHTFDTRVSVFGVLNFCAFGTKEFLVIRKWPDAGHATFVIYTRTYITTYYFAFFVTYPTIKIITSILKEIMKIHEYSV